MNYHLVSIMIIEMVTSHQICLLFNFFKDNEYNNMHVLCEIQ